MNREFVNFALESTNNNPYATVREKVNTWLKEHPKAIILQLTANLALSGDTTAYVVSMIVEHEETEKLPYIHSGAIAIAG